jgi:hypothetical protein
MAPNVMVIVLRLRACTPNAHYRELHLRSPDLLCGGMGRIFPNFYNR